MKVLEKQVVQQTIECIKKAMLAKTNKSHPYPHAIVRDLFPLEILKGLQNVALPHFQYSKGYGARNLYNKHRHYMNQENNRRYDCFNTVSLAFQNRVTVSALESCFDMDLSGSSLRIEFTQDTDGFWLEPHTDIGAKIFTLLIYISDGPGHDQLGTDIYESPDKPVGATCALPNYAFAFVPSDKTWHGFEKRPIQGVRKTVIVNYVTPDWRQRDELAFPDQAV